METISLIVSIVGTVSGVAGLVITIFTWNNTRKITKMVEADKIKREYNTKHPVYVNSLQTTLTALKQGENKYFIVTDLLRTCKAIRTFNDNWGSEHKEVINNFIEELDSIPKNQSIDVATSTKLQDTLTEIELMMERIGVLNDIR